MAQLHHEIAATEPTIATIKLAKKPQTLISTTSLGDGYCKSIAQLQRLNVLL
jgi:hypothetical protein